MTMTVVAGPCMAESIDVCEEVAETMRDLSIEFDFDYIFKASFDKANRTSGGTPRGPGLKEGSKILRRMTERFYTVTDAHDQYQVEALVGVVDMIQIPAMLSRQTDLLVAAGKRFNNIILKKGQGMNRNAAICAINKILEESDGSSPRIYICDRGNSFGYGDVVLDYRNAAWLDGMRGCEVMFDVSHTTQFPSSDGDRSGGDAELLAPVLAGAAVGAGVRNIFIETHPDPSKALSDGPSSFPLRDMGDLMETLTRIHRARG